MGLPTLVLVLFGAVWILAAQTAQARCIDAARVGARAAARGEPDAVVTRWAAALAPPGARVGVVREARTVRVDVRVDLRAGGSLAAILPPTAIDETVVAPVEGPAGSTSNAGDAGVDDG
jgi:hypothetical protein